MEAKELGKIIESFGPDYIITSQLTRVHQTYEISAGHLNIEPTISSLFNEQVSGPLNNTNVDINNHGYTAPTDSFNGGETYSSLAQRADDAWKWIRDNYPVDIDKKMVIISHGRFLSFFISVLLGFKPNGFNLACENTSYVIVRKKRGWRPQLVLPMPGEMYI